MIVLSSAEQYYFVYITPSKQNMKPLNFLKTKIGHSSWRDLCVDKMTRFDDPITETRQPIAGIPGKVRCVAWRNDRRREFGKPKAAMELV